MIDRTDYSEGVGRIRMAYLETDLFNLAGSGSIDLRDETLNLRFVPSSSQASLVKFAVPFRLTGSLSDPDVQVSAGSAPLAVAGAAVGVVNPLISVGTLLGRGTLSRRSPCEAAREIARDELDPDASPE